jgi:hypothetical protein
MVPHGPTTRNQPSVFIRRVGRSAAVSHASPPEPITKTHPVGDASAASASRHVGAFDLGSSLADGAWYSIQIPTLDTKTSSASRDGHPSGGSPYPQPRHIRVAEITHAPHSMLSPPDRQGKLHAIGAASP